MNTFNKIIVVSIVALACFMAGDIYRYTQEQRRMSLLQERLETAAWNVSRLEAAEESSKKNWDLIEAQFTEADRLYRAEARRSIELEKAVDRFARANHEADYLREELLASQSQKWAAQDELYYAQERICGLERQLRIAKHGVLGDAAYRAGVTLAELHLARRAVVAGVLQAAFEPPVE